MEKYLLLYTYVDGFSDTPFPSVENQVTVYDFSYDAKRMGGAPVISSTFMYDKCLNKEWSYKVYAMFNGERYFLKQIASSSYDNTDSRYKHEIELVSERIILDNVYVYDVVSSDVTYDKPVSNSSDFTFFGDIYEFAKRLNYSLEYSNIGYTVVVDAGITSEAKMVAFENSVFSNAIQEAYNTFNIPYYFVGKTIHIGYTNNDIAHIFRYGVDESLLSINKQNANQKTITRITGSGGSDNIPYYYPNDYESKDEVEASGGKWIIPQEKLMPPVYRNTSGAERFYNAINGQYEGYTFENEYVSGNQREHIIDFEDIKPSIVGITNAIGQRIDMFSDFAYDTNDNDEFDDEGNYIHPYFFAKLRKTDGDNGFNLFDHAIDENEMTISMTSGSCGACEWTVMVDKDTKKNTVQVDDNGNLLRDNDGNVKFGAAQDKQNDTRNNEVWIALKKDIDTFGVIMPNAEHNYRPSVNDTFVILHINLPKAYILSAEERLKDKLIEYMANNNSEKFNFSIAFSRIFFADNIAILNQLNENARLQVEYDKEVYTLYVSSYSYNMSSDCPLPEIKVELSDTLTISRNALQEAMDSVKADMISMMDTIGKNTAYPNVFIRKDRDDYTSHLVSFLAGLKAFNYVQGMVGGSGAAIFKDEAKKTVLEIDKIHAREELVVPKITFNCIDAISGDQAATFAYGTIKDVDRGNMTATLDLLEDQIGTLDVNDICRGVYHNLEGGNSTEEAVDDDNGFYKYAGFSTSYFTPVEIITNKPGEFVFRYELQPNTSIHPMKGMNFFAYGNFIDQSRQSITYQTRTYRRLLKNVNTWIINPDKNIAGQWGDLTGLNIGGQQMEGIGTFQENCYFTGAYIQFTPQQKEELQTYNVVLSSYEAVCRLDMDGNIVNSITEISNVVTSGSNVVTEDKNVVTSTYVFSTLIQAFRGDTALTYSGDTYAKNGYMVSYIAKGCNVMILNGCAYITEITNTEECWVRFTVNCEGNALFEKEFNISFVKDAKSPITIDLDNEVDSVLCDDDGKVLLGLPLMTTVSMWYGAEKLVLESIQLSKPSGMEASYDLESGIITVTEISNEASNVLQLGIAVSATYNSIKYDRNVFFTVNKVKQGKDGENSVLYQLMPSSSIIKIDKSGNYSTDTISCSLKKTDGKSSVTTTTELPEKYRIDVKTDSGSYSEYTLGSLIGVQSVKESVSFVLKYSEENGQYKNIDIENIPVIVDGTDGADGESNIYADIDNEMDSVACDNSGHVISTMLPTTTVSMWYGTTQLSLTGISISAPNGVTSNYTLSTGKISILSISDSAADRLPINISLTASYSGNEYMRTLVFTVNKVRMGANGENAVIYNLNPSASSIKVDMDGNYSTSSITCGILKNDGNSITSISSLPDGYSIYESIDDGTYSEYSLGTSVSVTSAKKSISFKLNKDNQDIDIETIPIIIDGKNGADGDSAIYADLTNEMSSVACDSSGSIISGLPITTTVSMYMGTSKLSLDIINLSVPSGISASSDLSSGIITVSSISASVDNVSRIGISVKATHGIQYTRNLTFTINKVNNGSDGQNSIIYQLLPSITTIKINSSGAYSPTEISCRLVRYDGTDVASVSSLPSGYSMKYSFDGGSENVYTIGNVLSTIYSTINFTFYLYKDSVLVDKETIPVISDGKTGDKGDPGADGTDGTDGKDGVNAQYYIVESSVSVIGVTSTGSYSPSSFIVSEYTINGASKTSSNVNYIHVYGMKNGSKSSRLTYSSSVNQWTFNASSYQSSDYDAFIFELVNSSSTSGAKLSTCTVGIARKGIDGEDGAQGPAGPQGPAGSTGAMGATLRPRGKYSSSETYVYNSEFRDCVYDSSGNVWMVKSYGDSITGSTPSSSNSRWLQGNKAIFTAIDTALIDNANIAGFLYSNQKMMSADKTSLILDGINGEITAIKGTIGGFTLASGGLTCASATAYINFPLTGNSYLRLNVSSSSALVDARNDGNIAGRFEAYGSRSIGIFVRGQAGDGSFAVQSLGSSVFRQRSGEVWKCPGVLAIAYISSTGSVTHMWGDGLASGYPTSHSSNISCTKTGTGKYTVYHYLGHTDYIALVQADATSNVWAHAKLQGRYSNYIYVATMTGGGSGSGGDYAFFVAILGRTKD